MGPNRQLSEKQPAAATDRLLFVPSAGSVAGFWWGELLGDQRPADAFSLVYDSAPLTESIAILGRAQATLRDSSEASRRVSRQV